MLDSNTILALGIGFGACVGWIARQETSNLGRKFKGNNRKRDYRGLEQEPFPFKQ